MCICTSYIISNYSPMNSTISAMILWFSGAMFSPNQKRTPEEPISSLLTPLSTPVPKNGKSCPDEKIHHRGCFWGIDWMLSLFLICPGILHLGFILHWMRGFLLLWCFCLWFVLDMSNHFWSIVALTGPSYMWGAPWFTHQMIFQYKSRIIDFFWDFG